MASFDPAISRQMRQEIEEEEEDEEP